MNDEHDAIDVNDAPAAPHSALYLTDVRDLWWNADFLALLARRAGLARARRVLDVGAGQGHWTRTIASLLSPGATVTGLEREPRWLEAARQTPKVNDVALHFDLGEAQALPYADGTFDVVTCQTLLIHVPDPRAVVDEMLRVLRPGGVLLLVEPNNLAEGVARLVSEPGFDLEGAVAYFRLQALGEKGKHALGKGYNSLGEGLVGLLDPARVTDVDVWNNDKCVVFLPGQPHKDRPELRDERRILDTGALAWSRDETLGYYLAGGGRPEEFDALWERARGVWRERIERLERGELAGNAGGLFYVLRATRRVA